MAWLRDIPLRVLCSAFEVPDCMITSDGALAPPGPPWIEIEHLSTCTPCGPAGVSLPMQICGLYNLVICLNNDALWVTLAKGGREMFSPARGPCCLDPFVKPHGRQKTTGWRLPLSTVASDRTSVTLIAAAMKRERGYDYRKAIARARSGGPIDTASCANTVRQTTTYRIECPETRETFTFQVHARRESLSLLH